MKKESSPALQTQENISVEKFAKCASYLRKFTDAHVSHLNEMFPDDVSLNKETGEVFFQKYLAIAKMLCQSSHYYTSDIILEFISIINGY